MYAQWMCGKISYRDRVVYERLWRKANGWENRVDNPQGRFADRSALGGTNFDGNYYATERMNPGKIKKMKAARKLLEGGES